MRFIALLAVLTSQAWASRWVVTSPQLTETIFQLGAGSHIVGVGEESHYPPEASKLPTIGSLFSPSIEKTLRLKPDWVILDTHTLNSSYAATLASLGIPSFLWKTQTPLELIEDARRFSKTVWRQPISAKTRHWENCFRRPPPPKGPSFIGFVWLDPPMILGKGSFLSSLFEHSGFRNLLDSKFHLPYFPISAEWLILRRPEVVFFLSQPGVSQAAVAEKIAYWWPRQTPGLVFLDKEYFARASFTALNHWTELKIPGWDSPCRKDGF